MAASAKIQPIKTEHLAQLFLELWQLEEAGVPSIEAIGILKNQSHCFKNQLNQLHQRLKSGNSIAESGFNIGLFNETQKNLIHAGETSGCLSTVYKQLANYYGEKSTRERKIKSRLYLPVFVLAIALFVQPLPELVGSQITAVEYLHTTLGRLFLILSAGFLAVRLPFWLTEGFLCGFKQIFQQMQLQIPGVADLLIKRQINDFLWVFAMMLEAGLPFSQALPKAVASIQNSVLRSYFNPALAVINQGETVSVALAKVAAINSTTLQIINSAEQSGKLAGSILHIAKLEAETIQLHNEMLAEWLPRLAYVAVAVWMAYSILNQGLSKSL